MDPAEDTIVTLAPSVSSFQTVRTSGLEVLLDRDKEIWRPLDLTTADSAICALLFGWCANIRSDGHVPTDRAALHQDSDGFRVVRTSGFPFWKVPLAS